MFDLGGDGFVIMRFALSDFEFGNLFTKQSVPEENFAAIGMGAESLAAGDDFFDCNHGVIIAHRVDEYAKIYYNIDNYVW